MKVIGIQIKGNKLHVAILEKTATGIIDITGKLKKIELDEDHITTNVKNFMNVVHRHFDSIAPDKIAIIKRNANAKGDHKPSPMSFKLEGLIQLYEAVEVELIPSQTIAAFLKKNTDIVINPTFNYQKEALELAHYLLK